MMTTKLETIEEILGSRARVRIIRVIAINEKLSFSQIIKLTKLNRASENNYLDFLIKQDLVQLKKFGRIKIYRYKSENIRAKSLNKYVIFIETPNKSY